MPTSKEGSDFGESICRLKWPSSLAELDTLLVPSGTQRISVLALFKIGTGAEGKYLEISCICEIKLDSS
jgi:hypothetical protein